MTNATYTVTHNRGTFVRGDTIDALEVVLTHDDTGEVIIPERVCAQVYTDRSRIMHEWDALIYGDGRVVLPAVTATWPPMLYNYRIQYHLEGGRIRTYIKGTFRVVQEGSPCDR